MNSIINAMVKYDHRQHELSDWLLELEQRFQLGEVETDKSKIIWCQLLIGATGNSILAGLEDDTTWETAKETLLSRLGAGSVRDEAWVALKTLTRGTKEIIELAGEAEKLAKRLTSPGCRGCGKTCGGRISWRSRPSIGSGSKEIGPCPDGGSGG